MKFNVTSFVAGLFLAVSGSLIASSTSVPYVFSSGQKAKASEVNANFTALANAINGVNSRVSSIESNANLNKLPKSLSVSQIDKPVGTKVTINGAKYTIVQFEFPRFDTDDVYIIKFPVLGDSTINQAYISVTGAYIDQELSAFEDSDFTVTNGINGFSTFGSERLDYSVMMYSHSSGQNVNTSFSQSISANILVGNKTRLSIFFNVPSQKQEAERPVQSADTTDLVSVYPPVKISSEREQIRQDIRQLLSYVVIKKK